ncbi:hypothetical protein CPB85DRAFT_1445160 [Mucidula mucida]|nr:hypothetical protein CPB85DRAFT_1445160 [Mucidula mucida]
MSTTTTTTQTAPSTRGKGGRRNNRGRGGNRAKNQDPAPPAAVEPDREDKADSVASDAPTVEEAVCWICAEPVKYYSVSQCNHRTCHVCSLRLRALYKKLDCTFCKEPQSTVIFTTSEDANYLSFTPETIPFKDERLAIFFETKEMMEDTLILLRFNCPDADCDFIAKGWADLKLHVRATHNKLMCDLCLRSKKVFAHEHALYAYPQLVAHLPSMNHRMKSLPDQIEGGIHPLCEFCRECFFGDDELFSHMRERHEECFLCKRNSVRDQYFLNYERLENHFNTAHHPCMQANCQAQKFVVFNTPLDLKAHMVDEHGADMSSRDMKDARRVNVDFEDVPIRRGGRRDREHEREPPPRQQAPPGPARRREGFGARLTTNANPSTSSLPTPPTQSRRASPSPPRDPVDPALLQKHNAFLARLQTFATNPTTAVPAVKAAIRGYRASETSAKDLISTIWNVLDRSLEHTASLINAFVDLLDEDDKKQDVLTSWKGFEVEQRQQFPDLVPTAVGTGYAGITSGRVLNAKHSTGSRSAQQSSRQVLDRVARAASSSMTAPATPAASQAAKFPPLSSSSQAPAFRQAQHKTPWSASAANVAAAPPVIRSVPGPKASGKAAPPPKLNDAVFPGLPSTGASRGPKPQIGGNASLRNILGANGAPKPTVWGAEGGRDVGEGGSVESGGGGEVEKKGKKGKGKQKQTLFTLGSFPT